MNKKNFHIMIVDRDLAIRKRLGKRLEEEGYVVNTASSAEEALGKFEQEQALPHIIFSDVRFQGMSGLEFLSAVKKLNEDVEFIIMTGYTTAEMAVEAVRLGAYDFISKDEFDNIDSVVAVCERATEKIKIRFQNINLLQEMEKQKELMEKKANELDRKSQQLNRLNKSIMKSQLEAEQRLQLTNKVYSLLDPQGVLQSACDLLADFHENTNYMILIVERDSNEFKTLASSQSGDSKIMNVVFSRPELENENDEKAVTDYFVNDKKIKNAVSDCWQTSNYMVKLIKFKQDVIAGVMLVIGKEGVNLARFYGLDEMLMFISNAYESAVLHAKVNEMAIKDGLTNLFNHKHFMEELDREIKKAIRYKFPVSLLFFDIDHFKKFNDQNGHQIGDAVLKKVAKILRQNQRDMDYIAVKHKQLDDQNSENKDYELVVSRYGGEEFAVILPHTNLDGAFIAGERLRKKIEEADFPCQEKQPLGTLTISMGVAEVSVKVNTPQLLVLVADAALYKAKKEGRNRVIKADKVLIDAVVDKGKLEL